MALQLDVQTGCKTDDCEQRHKLWCKTVSFCQIYCIFIIFTGQKNGSSVLPPFLNSSNYSDLATDKGQAQDKQNYYTHLCKAHGRCVRTSRSKLSSEHIKDLFWGSEELKPCLSMHSPPHCQTKAFLPFKMWRGGGETNNKLHLWWPNITVNRIHSPQAKVCKVYLVTVKASHICVNILAESDTERTSKLKKNTFHM